MVNKDSLMQLRRRLTPDARRGEILEAAEKLLVRRGLSVRVEDIVAEAGAAKGTFYACFESWDELLEAIRSRRAGTYHQLADAAVASAKAGEAAAALRDLGHGAVEFILGLGGLHEVLFHSPFALARPLPPDQRPSADIAAILRAAPLGGAVDPEPTAEMLFAAIHQAADAIAAGADRGRTLQALEVLLRRVIEPAGAAQL